MKLARPDVFHPRIVLAGCPQHPGGYRDDAGLVTALRARGLHARWLSWDDPATGAADLVILRAAGDHAERRDEFLAWTRTVANLLNPPGAVAWNLGERYLRDLEDAGVPTQPSRPARTALIFLGGQRSHAFSESRSVEPDFDVWDVGHAALAAAAECVGIAASELLQVRVDVNGDGLVSLDLLAPSLGWRRLDTGARDLAQRGFAVAVESALHRLGLGPLSHRRP
jgi:hypothetical protein